LARIVNEGTDNFSGKTVTLAADINLAGKEWAPIGPTYPYCFDGTLEGGGRTIANLKIETEAVGSALYGLFGFIDHGTLNNVNLTGVKITLSTSASICAGGLVGANEGTVTGCTVSGDIVVSSSSEIAGAGGLIGTNRGTVTSCIVNGSITASSESSYVEAGGLVGRHEGGTIKACTTRASVTASSSDSSTSYFGVEAGGLAGVSFDRCTVTGCDASGRVTALGPNVTTGGLLGEALANATITNNRFSLSGTGQKYGIGRDRRGGPIDDGVTPY
jgi:hypothetical protein